MRRVLKLVRLTCVIALILFVIQVVFIPLVFNIKEPYFLMPTSVAKKVESPQDIPIRNDDYGDGEFGAKRRGGRKHNGIDIAAKLKSPVYAAKSGIACWRFVPGGYGNLVIIKHPGGWQTRYGHLNKSFIAKPRWVWQGEVIGLIGKTGNANTHGIKPHLHFEIRHKNKPVDPAVKIKGG